MWPRTTEQLAATLTLTRLKSHIIRQLLRLPYKRPCWICLSATEFFCWVLVKTHDPSLRPFMGYDKMLYHGVYHGCELCCGTTKSRYLRLQVCTGGHGSRQAHHLKCGESRDLGGSNYISWVRSGFACTIVTAYKFRSKFPSSLLHPSNSYQTPSHGRLLRNSVSNSLGHWCLVMMAASCQKFPLYGEWGTLKQWVWSSPCTFVFSVWHREFSTIGLRNLLYEFPNGLACDAMFC